MMKKDLEIPPLSGLPTFINSFYQPSQESSKKWREDEENRRKIRQELEEEISWLCMVAQSMTESITDHETFKEWRNTYFTPIIRRHKQGEVENKP